ncbi:Pectinesterase 2 [Choanephora cucurbitarum]|uniref:pectinesterase n=1 Tax=Choanephora cucurbitarum TaxID=101091 RepID=A0A1C7N901_9FUNG|nr:Pectinesterase 2 [Choanephora cucurbitarum]
MKYFYGTLFALLAYATLSLAATVNVCPTCTYKTVSAALTSIPGGSTEYRIDIAPGVYHETFTISRSNIILAKKGDGEVVIEYAIGHDTQGSHGNTTEMAVVTITGSNIRFYDITIANTYKQTFNIANVALSVKGKQVGFYRSKIYGFQDTLLINEGATVYFKSCYVEGNVDFIYGYGTGYFQECNIASNGVGYVTAQKRRTPNSEGGLYFNGCYLIPTLPSGPIAKSANPSHSFTRTSRKDNTSYLGRPWNENARVIFISSQLGSHIRPEGWSIWSRIRPNISNVLFGEYGNSGPRSSLAKRKYTTKLTPAQAAQYSVGGVFGSTSWIDTTSSTSIKTFDNFALFYYVSLKIECYKAK